LQNQQRIQCAIQRNRKVDSAKIDMIAAAMRLA
jgi:hypothetical protein